MVVAFPGGTVRDRIRAFGARDLGLFLGDDRSSDGSTEQVVTFVHRVRPHHRKYEVACEFLAQIGEYELARSRAERLVLEACGLLRLADIGAIGDDLTAEAILEPAQDDRGVEAPRIGEHHFLDIFVCHREFRHEPWVRAVCCRISGRLSHTMTAFWACSRFSACSSTTERGPSSTASVISSPRCAGRQCITSAWRAACANRTSLTWKS